ncbi:MAG: NHL repeat-containing protein, partial [Planctomycetota bacterium]
MMTACLIALASVLIGQTTNLTYDSTLTDELQYPARLAAASGGGIYVTDPPTNRVIQFNASGVVVGTYSIPEGPLGIAVHGQTGNIIISRADGVVGIYDGSFSQTGALDPAPFTMTAPNDIAIDASNGEIYVADSEEHRIMVFDPNTAALVRMWGTEGYGLSEFQSPQAIAIDENLGHVIVADVDNFRVQVYDTAGLLQYKFGYRIAYVGMDATAWVARSEGLAVDSCSNIYVTDALMGTIRAFSPTGQDLDIANPPVGYGTGPGELRVPCDVLIEGSTLFVASTNNAAVEVFTLVCGTAAAAPPAHGPGGKALGSAGGAPGKSAKRL